MVDVVTHQAQQAVAGQGRGGANVGNGRAAPPRHDDDADSAGHFHAGELRVGQRQGLGARHVACGLGQEFKVFGRDSAVARAQAARGAFFGGVQAFFISASSSAKQVAGGAAVEPDDGRQQIVDGTRRHVALATTTKAVFSHHHVGVGVGRVGHGHGAVFAVTGDEFTR